MLVYLRGSSANYFCTYSKLANLFLYMSRCLAVMVARAGILLLSYC